MIDPTVTIKPANEAACGDLQTVFGERGSAAYCQCQRYKLAPKEAFRKFPVAERQERLEAQTHCGHPGAGQTSGLVAYLDGEPVGWCAVEPRTAYPSLVRVYRTPWEDRDEDKTDPTAWAVTCIVVRVGYRRRGIAHALAKAAVEHAKARGARVVERYPMRTDVGEVTWDEIHVGTEGMFAVAGLKEVSRPGKRRLVMRLEF
jgi:ribosomal protein S18 acetylase RimI-like enzyme